MWWKDIIDQAKTLQRFFMRIDWFFQFFNFLNWISLAVWRLARQQQEIRSNVLEIHSIYLARCSHSFAVCSLVREQFLIFTHKPPSVVFSHIKYLMGLFWKQLVFRQRTVYPSLRPRVRFVMFVRGSHKDANRHLVFQCCTSRKLHTHTRLTSASRSFKRKV